MIKRKLENGKFTKYNVLYTAGDITTIDDDKYFVAEEELSPILTIAVSEKNNQKITFGLTYEDINFIYNYINTSNLIDNGSGEQVIDNSTPKLTLWAENVIYNIGEVVIYNGAQYTCLQTHTSNSVNTPTVTALWKKRF